MVGIATGMIGAAIVGGAVSAYGQHSANSVNQAINSKNLAWQEKMRATAYQATMQDMRKAGLNPILAASRGATNWGTPTPMAMHSATGGVADAIQKTISSGAQASKTPWEIENLRQDIDNKLQTMWTAEAQEALNIEQKNFLTQGIAKTIVEMKKIGVETDKIAISNRIDRLKAQFYERFPSAIAFKELGSIEGLIFGPLDSLLRNYNNYAPSAPVDGTGAPLTDDYRMAP
jgi:hypothetical protein